LPTGLFGKGVTDGLYTIGEATVCLYEQNNNVSIRRAAPGSRDHGAVKAPAGPKQSRRVDKDDLRLAFQRNPSDARAGCLHLMGHDRDLGPDHAIEQRGFPGIGLSDQGDETAAS